MVFEVARPQALVERWGGRALLPPEGTRPQPHFQRGEPSTSTSELRVRPATGRSGTAMVRYVGPLAAGGARVGTIARAIAILRRRSTGAPRRISRPLRRPSVIWPSSARTKV